MFDAIQQFPPEKRWREQKFATPVIVAFIKRFYEGETQFLLIKRNSSPHLGKWALVGGKWDFGETLPAGALREVKEETGLTCQFVAWRAFVNERMAPNAPNGVAAHFFLFVCEVAPLEGEEATEQEEGAVGWFTESQLATLSSLGSIIPSDFTILQQYGNASDKLPHAESDMLTDAHADDVELVRFEAFD